jgi:3-hydroxyisobutyrate dehydrogenase-like beta-hydroxyacid dehydrogenase
MTTLGFIGLGRMGLPMARRLLAAGHEVVGFDIQPAARDVAEAAGTRLVASPRAVGDAAGIAFLSLPSPAIVLQAVLGEEGLGSGKRLELCVDLSTSGPETAIRLAAGLAERGVATVEAPVSGGLKGAREGKLALMVSGPEAAFQRALPLLEQFGRAFNMGEKPGAGQMMKLVNNLLGACAIAITAEGMAIGIKAGLDPARMVDVLNVSSGRSSATEDKWPRSVLPRSFDFGFTAGLSLKDVRLCLEAARSLEVPLAVGESVRALLERTVDRYGPDTDFTSMARILEADAGLDLPQPPIP